MKPPAILHWVQPDDPDHVVTAYLRKLTRWGTELRLGETPPAEGTVVTVGLIYLGGEQFLLGKVTSVCASEAHGHVVWVQFDEPKPANESRYLIAVMKPLMGEPIDLASRLGALTRTKPPG